MTSRTRSVRPAAALAILALGAAPLHADNSTRFAAIQGALASAAPATNGWSTGLAGVSFGPFTLQRFDTPDNRSFGPEAAVQFPMGPTLQGLGTPAAAWAFGAPCTMPDGRSYGTKTDLAPFWWAGAATPAFPACATNTHLAYNDLLRAVRTCGNRCFVDIASLSQIDGIHAELRGAILTWLAGKPADARLVLRVTEGFIAMGMDTIVGEVEYFSEAVTAGAGRVEVYGIPMLSGAAAFGTWSHAKTFGVYDLSSETYRAMIGGQNHWTAYHTAAPPFDSNTMIIGQAATLPALQLDAAVQWFDDGLPWSGHAVWWGPATGQLQSNTFKWAQAGYGNSGFGRFSGIANVNPRTVAGMAPGQRALVSLIDMGDLSTGHLGRTIARVLHDLVMTEPRGSDIRVFGQTICRGANIGIDGDCGGRHEQTYMGRLVFRALTAAMMGWRSNVWVLTSAASISNGGYPSAYQWRVRRSLKKTAEAIACTWNGGYQPGWEQLRFFNNPRGRGWCSAAVKRAINARFHWRTTTAFINGFAARQPVGVHHKIVMFGREAMYQGSFNGYQSGSGMARYDSKLVENGAIILDPDYVSGQVAAFDEAWSAATPVIGGD